MLWHRVRAFMATRDLLILPTVAVPPFPVDQPYPTEINGKPLDSYFQWFYLTYGITLTGLPGFQSPAASRRVGCPSVSRSSAADVRRPPSYAPPRRSRPRHLGPAACLRWSPHSPQDGAPLPNPAGMIRPPGARRAWLCPPDPGGWFTVGLVVARCAEVLDRVRGTSMSSIGSPVGVDKQRIGDVDSRAVG